MLRYNRRTKTQGKESQDQNSMYSRNLAPPAQATGSHCRNCYHVADGGSFKEEGLQRGTLTLKANRLILDLIIRIRAYSSSASIYAMEYRFQQLTQLEWGTGGTVRGLLKPRQGAAKTGQLWPEPPTSSTSSTKRTCHGHTGTDQGLPIVDIFIAAISIA